MSDFLKLCPKCGVKVHPSGAERACPSCRQWKFHDEDSGQTLPPNPEAAGAGRPIGGQRPGGEPRSGASAAATGVLGGVLCILAAFGKFAGKNADNLAPLGKAVSRNADEMAAPLGRAIGHSADNIENPVGRFVVKHGDTLGDVASTAAQTLGSEGEPARTKANENRRPAISRPPIGRPKDLPRLRPGKTDPKR